MREIKLRAKIKAQDFEQKLVLLNKPQSDGEWAYGELHVNSKIPHIHVGQFRYSIDVETIGQFTGLKDKNEKEIYEGDIVLTPFIDPIFGDMLGEELCVKREVLFNNGSFVVKVDNGYIYLECFTRGNNAEVIGNIYDNKEYLV